MIDTINLYESINHNVPVCLCLCHYFHSLGDVQVVHSFFYEWAKNQLVNQQ